MARQRRVFGPLFYFTLIFAAIYLLSLGAWWIRPHASRAWTLWSLSRQLADPDPGVRKAADALVKAGGDAVPWVRPRLKDRDPGIRLLACEVLGRIRFTAAVIPDLAAAMGDGDRRVRLAAVQGLRAGRAHGGEDCDASVQGRVVETLRPGLNDPSWEVRRAAISALAAWDPTGRACAADVEAATHDRDSRVRALAALRLDEYRPYNPRAIAALREVIADPESTDEGFEADVGTRGAAIQSLRARRGEPAMIEAIEPLLASPDARTRFIAVRAVPILIPETGALSGPLPAMLRRMLGDRDARVRGEAARKLLYTGQKADAAVIAALRAAADVPVANSDQLTWLCQYLLTLKASSPGSEVRSVPNLLEAIDRMGAADQVDILDFLGSMGPDARAAVPKLVELSGNADARLAAHAERALGKIAPGAMVT